ncbi:MAG: peptidase M23 [Candidatus Poribacteria bacterium]|nr:MAG: peptidase M23 [Candidatus Poribacteria bacterium]
MGAKSARRLRGVFLCCLLGWAAWILLVSSPAVADPSLSEAERRRAEQLKRRQEAEAQRLQMLSQEKSLLEFLDRIEGRIERLQRSIQATQRRIQELEANIQSLIVEIARLTVQQDARKELVAKRLRALYQLNYLNGDGMLLFALSADNVSDLLVRLEYVTRIRKKDNEILERYRADEERLRLHKAQLEQERRRLDEQRIALETEQNRLAAERAERAAVLATIRKNRQLQERLIRELDASIRQLTELIRRLEQQRQQQETLGPPQAQVIGTTKGATLAAVRLGNLPWPVEGEILTNVSPALEGITIRAPEGTPVRAVLAGTVEYADRFNGLGFGNLIVLNHGDGVRTFYAHLSEFLVQPGDRVEQGQPIGKVGSTGSLVGSALYFEMREQFEVINFRSVAR